MPSRRPTVSQALAPWMAVELDLHRLEAVAVDGDALAQGFDLGLGRVALHPHAVFAQPAGRGQFQPPLQLAVVGQQQQAFGVEVKPPDRHHAGHVFGQVVEDRVAALFVGGRGDQPLGLVIKPQARRVRARPTGSPRTVILSAAVTFSAGEVMILPLTVTSPSSISRSASRREATPARDRTLAMRSPVGVASAVGLCGGVGLFFSGHGRHPWRGVANPGGFRPRTPEDI